jgi:inhibitor of the pro-sigma K processing machinery
MFVELLVLVLAIILAAGLYYFMKNLLYLLVHAIVGVIVLMLVNLFLFPPVSVNLITVLVVGFGGIPGLLVVLLLHLTGIAF